MSLYLPPASLDLLMLELLVGFHLMPFASKKIQIKYKPPAKPGHTWKSEWTHRAMGFNYSSVQASLSPGARDRGWQPGSDPRAVRVPGGDRARWVPALVTGFCVLENIELLCGRCHGKIKLLL